MNSQPAPPAPTYARRGNVVLGGRSLLFGTTVVRWYAGEHAALSRARPLARANWQAADVAPEAHPDTVREALTCADALARRPWASPRQWATHRRTRRGLRLLGGQT